MEVGPTLNGGKSDNGYFLAQYSGKGVSEEYLDKCYSACKSIEYVPKDIPTEDLGYDFWAVFGALLVRGTYRMGYDYLERQMEISDLTVKGTAILAFICKEGVVVAVESSKSGFQNFMKFSSHEFGFAIGEASECEKFVKKFRDQQQVKHSGYIDDDDDFMVRRSCVPEDWLVGNMNGLSGILIAVWGEKGPCLYLLDHEGNRHRRVMFACGSCCEYGDRTLGYKNYPFLPINVAAKWSAIAMRLALARIGEYCGSVNVYYLGRRDGLGEFHEEAIIMEEPSYEEKPSYKDILMRRSTMNLINENKE